MIIGNCSIVLISQGKSRTTAKHEPQNTEKRLHEKFSRCGCALIKYIISWFSVGADDGLLLGLAAPRITRGILIWLKWQRVSAQIEFQSFYGLAPQNSGGGSGEGRKEGSRLAFASKESPLMRISIYLLVLFKQSVALPLIIPEVP